MTLAELQADPTFDRHLILTPSPAWLTVAVNVLAGHYRKADDSTTESIQIGLRSLNHPLAAAALKRLTD